MVHQAELPPKSVWWEVAEVAIIIIIIMHENYYRGI